MNWKISTARKNKTDIIKPKTPARQGNWNKQKNKQTNNQSVIWRTIPYNNNNDDDWSSALNGQHWTFVSPSTNFKPTLRMNYIRARGIDDEDFKSSQSPSSNRTTNSLSRAISTATSQHRQEENKINKKSIQSMPWIYFFFNSACILDALIRFVFCITCSFV